MIMIYVGLILGGFAVFTLAASRQIEARYPVVGALVDVGPGVIHVVHTPPAAPERGAVLLVHGASGNFADLNVALAGRLSALGFRVFSVDRPGHGWSARLGGREMSSLERQAGFLRQALEREGVARALVVVHSLAGVVGLSLALDSPGFVKGLTLLAPVSHPWPGGVSWYYDVGSSRLWGPLFRWCVALPGGLLSMNSGVRGVFEPAPAPPNYIERTRLPLFLRPWHFKSNAEDVADTLGYVKTLHTRYGAINAPTAIVTGAQDGVVSPSIHSQALKREIPGATLRLLEGVGHSPHYTATDEVIAAILEVDARSN